MFFAIVLRIISYKASTLEGIESYDLASSTPESRVTTVPSALNLTVSRRSAAIIGATSSSAIAEDVSNAIAEAGRRRLEVGTIETSTGKSIFLFFMTSSYYPSRLFKNLLSILRSPRAAKESRSPSPSFHPRSE